MVRETLANAAIYDLPFKASAKTLTTIAADPKHLGARLGMTSVLAELTDS